MSINKIQVAVNGKTISSKPIERILVRGEKDSNVIVFTLDRIWNGIDISASGLAYQVLGRNGDGKPCVDMLRKGDGATPDTFTLTWVISSRFTNASGKLDIWIDIMRGGESLDLNWNTTPVSLFVSDGYVITDYEPLTQQLLGAIAELLAKSQESEAAASNSAADAANSAAASKKSADDSAESAAAAKSSENAAEYSQIEARKSQIAAKESEILSKTSAEELFNGKKTFAEWFAELQNTLDENQAAALFNKTDKHERSTIVANQAHGMRLNAGKLQLYDGVGWITLMTIPVGLTAEYIRNLKLTAIEIRLMQLTSRQIRNLSEREAN